MSFGFSVGDFLATIQLVWDVSKALRESHGSVHDHTAVLHTLRSFSGAVSACQAVAYEWQQLAENGEITLPERSVVNGVNFQLDWCRERLDSFLNETEKYTRSFMKQRSSRTVKDQLRKLQWMFKKEDVDKLQEDLSNHVQALHLSVSALGLQVMTRSMNNFANTTDIVKATSHRVTEVHGMLQTLHSEFPKLLGYSWEGGFSAHDKPIVFMDAIGRTVHIPFLFCLEQKIFHDLLEIMFRNVVGHRQVVQQQYNLVRQGTDDFIDESTWNTLMAPGSTVLMNVLIRIAPRLKNTRWAFKYNYPQERCPSCHIPMQLMLMGWASQRCFKDFRILKKQRLLDRTPKPLPMNRPGVASQGTGSRNSQELQTQHKNPLEIAHFQRVHLLQELVWVDINLASVYKRESVYTPTALHIAVESGSLSEVERIFEVGLETDIDARDTKIQMYGSTCLQRAAMHGHFSIVHYLIQRGADVHAAAGDGGGRTLLQAAAGLRDLNFVNYVLELGVNVNAMPSRYCGRTALQAAAGPGTLDSVERLFEAGADINAPLAKLFGWTALQAAVESGSLDIVEQLLEAGADVNALPAERVGLTALQAAAESGSLDIVERLLEVGADVNAPPAERVGLTALQAAARSGSLDIVERLLEAGADVNAPPAEGGGCTALQAAARSGSLDIVECLLEAGADVNAPPAEEFGRTALQAAARSGSFDIAKRLLEAGADVNAPPAEDNGCTALQAAARSGSLDIVECLLEAGADVNAGSTNRYQTALEAAVMSDSLDVVDRLLKAGADVNVRGLRGTAYQIAKRRGNHQIMSRLEAAGATIEDDS